MRRDFYFIPLEKSMPRQKITFSRFLGSHAVTVTMGMLHTRTYSNLLQKRPQLPAVHVHVFTFLYNGSCGRLSSSLGYVWIADSEFTNVINV